mmetsp:Transcript_48878/g.121266  ORF Transcript_48878/g.121266 Transcript_48878/m.121266 type:complete len:211 (+) Transcript_48878:658-1290(+)
MMATLLSLVELSFTRVFAACSFTLGWLDLSSPTRVLSTCGSTSASVKSGMSDSWPMILVPDSCSCCSSERHIPMSVTIPASWKRSLAMSTSRHTFSSARAARPTIAGGCELTRSRSWPTRRGWCASTSVRLLAVISRLEMARTACLVHSCASAEMEGASVSSSTRSAPCCPMVTLSSSGEERLAIVQMACSRTFMSVDIAKVKTVASAPL